MGEIIAFSKCGQEIEKEDILREKYVSCGRFCRSGNPLLKKFPWNTLNFMQFCFRGCQICIHIICEETKNSFKITEFGIDTNQHRACKYNYFSHVNHADIVLEICFSIPITRYLRVFNYKHVAYHYYVKSFDKKSEGLLGCSSYKIMIVKVKVKNLRFSWIIFYE